MSAAANTRVPGDTALLAAALESVAHGFAVLAGGGGRWHEVRVEGGALLADAFELHPFDPERTLGVFASPGGFELILPPEGGAVRSASIRIERTEPAPEAPEDIIQSLAGRRVLYRLRTYAGTETPCGLEWDAGRAEVTDDGAWGILSLTTGAIILLDGASRNRLNPAIVEARGPGGSRAEIRA